MSRLAYRSRSSLAFVTLLAAPFAVACGSTASPDPAPAPSPASAPPAKAAPGYTLLGGNLPPAARPPADIGRMDPGAPLEGMSLLLKTSAQQKVRARSILSDLQDPMSARYHRWLKPADVEALLGASSTDMAAAVSFLRSSGFTVHGPSSTGTRILFSGTVGQLEQAFRTEMHRYDVKGERHFAPSVAPSIPTALAPFVLALHGVHDFKLRPLNYGRPAHPVGPRPDAIFEAGTLADGGGPGQDVLTLAPPDFATIYDVNALYTAGIDGTGQKIGIMGEGDFIDADVVAFRTLYGLDTSLVPIRDLVPMSGATYMSPYAYGETILDLEWSGAVAKGAQVYYVYTGNNPAYGVYDAITWSIEEDLYPVLSISYGGCEEGLTPSEDIYLETMGDAAAMEGITIAVASGDLGPATCEFGFGETAATQGLSVDWPASVPSFVAVGGTMLDWGDPIPEAPITSAVAAAAPFSTYWSCSLSGAPNCSPTGYVPETAWNELPYELSSFNYFWGASGGGVSTLFQKPYWQVGQTPPGSMRMVPDVSLTAAYAQVGYLVSQSWVGDAGSYYPPVPEALAPTGGTSAASPSFAGILALVNQSLAAKNPTDPVGLGNANPTLYALDSSTKGGASPAFHDITTGDTYVPCATGTPDCPASPPYQYGYAARKGYDMATGIGSIDANNLVNAWTALTPTSTTLAVTPSGTTEGSTVTLTATISSTAKSKKITGSVVFYVDTVDEAGASDLATNVASVVTATLVGGKEGGTATATIVPPPGVLEKANIVAFFGGDAHYLASWSSASSVTMTSTLAVTPTAPTMNPNAKQTFTATGGVPPILWSVLRDTTCSGSYYYYLCAQIQSTGATTAEYQAGGADGTTIVQAIDSEGAEVRVLVTVSGAPVDAGLPHYDGGFTPEASMPEGAVPIDATLPDAGSGDAAADADLDAGVDSPVDGGGSDAVVIHDASKRPEDAKAPGKPPKDATVDGANDGAVGAESDVATSTGCSCRAAGSAPAEPPGGALAGLALGAVFLGRRKRATPRREV